MQKKEAKQTRAALELQAIVRNNIRMILARFPDKQETFASSMQLSQASISKKLNGKIDWTAADIANAASYFNLPFQDLVSPTALKDYLFTAPEISQQSSEPAMLAGSPRYFVKPDPDEERGQTNGPRMFVMPDPAALEYTRTALRRMPQSRLMMGSPTWTRTKTKGSKDPCAAITPWGNGECETRQVFIMPHVSRSTCRGGVFSSIMVVIPA